ncbi:glycoside hydrolase family 3 N-terminal domain-containing protein [uncultured Muriicola sp.]|uniref:glycoside hydrolase family 3 protein n=1 Tax=uncultured Muriicola sp. TaxID=1583102 RepID=UPI0026180566|nr:glycoside hydrolase family 3 N-terminal domain-containing protein [uncultured Muriicola sp.]
MEKKEQTTVPTNIMPFKEATCILTDREKIGQFFMPAAFINDSEASIKSLESLIRKESIGGICFFHSRASAATNYEGKKKITYNKNSFQVLKDLIVRYSAAAKYPLLISIDAEWGLAMRVEETPQYPYAITLGAAHDPQLVYEVGKKVGSDCKAAGIHWNFAPVADVNNNPNNPVIGYRSFGSNKKDVSTNAIAFSKGLQDAGILGCSKHFPGHGDTATDSHLGLPVIDKYREDLFEQELYPFMELIKNNVDAVMVGHLSVPAFTKGKQVSASVSDEIIKGLLRGELGYDGVVVSDALNMHSVSKTFPKKGGLEWAAFNAGNDILCFAENVKEGIDAILKKATNSQIEESFNRVWALKIKAISQASTNLPAVSDPDPLNALIAGKCLTFYKGSQEILSEFLGSGFYGIQFGKSKLTAFFDIVNERTGSQSLLGRDRSFKNIKSALGANSKLLIAVYPPSIKPQLSFGMDPLQLEILIELIRKYDVVLYLFGNPYFLRLLPLKKVSAIIIAYQDLKGFEENAAAHFLGNTKAVGSLPVSL